MFFKNLATSACLAVGVLTGGFAIADSVQAQEVAFYEYTCSTRGTSFTIDKDNYILMFHKESRTVSFSNDYAKTFIDIGTWSYDSNGNVSVRLIDGSHQTIPGLMNQKCDSFYGPALS